MKFSITLFFCIFILALNNSYSQMDSYLPKEDSQFNKSESNTLRNVAVIRLKDEYRSKNSANSIMSASGFKIIDRPLKESQAISLNRDMKKVSVQQTNNLSKIFEAENKLLRTYIIEYPEDMSSLEFCKKVLMNNPAIEFAEPYYINKIHYYIPNDPSNAFQEQLTTISAYDAWEINKGSADIIIAISDNGIDQLHEDLEPNLAINEDEIPSNGIDDDNNGYIDDYKGYNFAHNDDNTPWGTTFIPDNHGTEVSGIAAATFDNNIGISGIGGKSKLFPIKTASSKRPTFIIYGYQSIIYAAQRGFDVINLSWGDHHPYSEYEQSVIDYGNAMGLIIVGSAGNLEVFDSDVATYYPAGYSGVLCVGEVDQQDFFNTNTSMTEHLDILAPGFSNYTTKIEQQYGYTGRGTSYASPVIAGVAAVVKNHFPELTNLQAVSYLRQCTDDVSGNNPGIKDLLPGRINMLKALESDPMSMLGIEPISIEFKDISGQNIDRFINDQDVYININAHNYLGQGENVYFELSEIWTSDDATVEIINDNQIISLIQKDSDLLLDQFTIRVNGEDRDKVIFKVLILAENGYVGEFRFSITPSKDITTFANNKIRFSMGDKGTFGFNDYESNRLGEGFSIKNRPNHLWKAGLMAKSGFDKAVSSLFSFSENGNDFKTLKAFEEPERNISIISDSKAFIDEQVGIEIKQKVEFLGDNDNAARITITAKNIGGETLMDFAVGYNFDWDVIDNYDNRASLFPEAIPETFAEIAAAAEIVQYKDSALSYGSIVYSDHEDAVAQAASLYWQITNNFTIENQVLALSRGTSWQIDTLYDVNYVIGMLFEGMMNVGEERECIICVGGAETKEELAQSLKDCILGGTSVETEKLSEFKLFPNPAYNHINIETELWADGSAKLSVVDITGAEVLKIRFDAYLGLLRLPLDVSGLNSGTYYLTIALEGKEKKSNFVISR